MANIVKDNSNRVYQNPAKLLFLIPIGTVIFIILFDLVFLKYNEYRLNTVTEIVIKSALDHEQFSSELAMQEYIERRFKEEGYTENLKTGIVIHDKYIVINATYSFFSLRGYVLSKDAHASSVMIGYYDEYKNPVAEKYENNQEIPNSNYYIFQNEEIKVN